MGIEASIKKQIAIFLELTDWKSEGNYVFDKKVAKKNSLYHL